MIQYELGAHLGRRLQIDGKTYDFDAPLFLTSIRSRSRLPDGLYVSMVGIQDDTKAYLYIPESSLRMIVLGWGDLTPSNVRAFAIANETTFRRLVMNLSESQSFMDDYVEAVTPVGTVRIHSLEGMIPAMTTIS